ncbi:nicotinate-nucleotide adenylyltransferase [Brevibacillus borstelensis]|jgi:nicotinate-nucleotide adenylyltransferase|uniref:Probable nicotinate-nucleotide adenylyltransferase n=1 Tax=Brevibacillus borstelensis AK1 TaxID=1300222 RepID=M8DBK4_9BACL|nr:nicotinate-nucleotide adenylyltransferase [Brevibacillus borstelensis]EMT50793.1 nicotinate-nucleotide adenylyltransferase [Brevibacillus borstelensis AK1]MED1743349.1 nicotinate-nucleotide adenylyltransferase [Brevibacillus borstelensis]
MGQSKIQIGIMGGTFDPIHAGHLLAAEQAREQAGLDEVWFMPAHIPPHKERAGLTPAGDRLRMVELAVADHPAFRAIDIELKRGGPSYTYDTMRSLVEMYPDCQFSFIIGGDMVKTLRQWYRIDDLVKMVRFIGLSRPGAELIESEYRDFVTLVEMPAWDLSSTLIREKAARGKSIRYLVPPPVERYIKEYGLYELVE